MRIRKQPMGDRNICGARVEERRKEIGMKQKDLLAKMQTNGVDIGETSLSMLEGQFRAATDKELWALAEIFGVAIEDLYNKDDFEVPDAKTKNDWG